MSIAIEIKDYSSPFHCPDSYRDLQLAKAAKYVDEGMTMHVNSLGVWSGSFSDLKSENCTTSRSVSSYEKIGYHTGAEFFLQGFLQAGGKVIFNGFRGIKGEVSLQGEALQG